MQQRGDKYFEDNKPFEGLARASLRSGALLVSARLLNVIIQVGSTIVLARLLDPYDYGLATIVLAITLFAPILVDLGTTDASTQQTRITRRQISTLFWLNLAMGLTLTVLMASASWAIASVFNEPALVNITLMSSFTFVLTGLFVQHYALMRRAMEFDRVAAIDICANVLSSVVSILMALTGWSYWALVAKPILQLTLTAVGAWVSCAWVPGPPSVDEDVKKMVRFGLGVTGFAATDHLTRSADRLAIGYVFGPGQLGYYQNAYLLYGNLIGVLAESLHNVAISGLSKLKEDARALKRAWSQALSLVSFISSAAFAVLAVTSEDLVVLLLGERWAPAGPILCVFAIRGIAQGVERTLGWLHIVAGRSDRWMRWGFLSAGCLLIALVVGLPFGPMGVATAYAIVMFGLFVPALVYAGSPLGIDARDVLSACGPQVIGGLVSAGAGLALEHVYLADLTPLVRLSLSIPFCLTVYFVIVVGVFRVTHPVQLAGSLVRHLTARRVKDH